MGEPLEVDITDGVAHLRLNRPEAANALDVPLALALQKAVARVAGDDTVRTVLLTGAGRRFCAGGDVRSFLAAQDRSAHLHRLASEADAAVRALAELRKPVVCAVHGAVAGAGLAVMLSCDVVLADPATTFVFAYTGIGLTPDCGVSWLLPRAMGQQRALAFALSGAPLSAEQAQHEGLVAEVTPQPDLRARELAQAWSAGPAVALGRTRSLLRGAWDLERGEAGAEEARTIAGLIEGEEAGALLERFANR